MCAKLYGGVIVLPEGFDGWNHIAARLTIASVEGVLVGASNAKELPGQGYVLPVYVVLPRGSLLPEGPEELRGVIEHYTGHMEAFDEVDLSKASGASLEVFKGLVERGQGHASHRVDACDVRPVRRQACHRLVGLDEQLAHVEDVGLLASKFGRGAAAGACNWVFTGPPGVGKSSLATMLVECYDQLGITNGEGNLVHASLSDVTAEYVGQSEAKVARLFDKASGGVLVVDEAYAICRNGYGTDVIASILSSMDRHQDDVITIMAGYDAPMRELLQTNPGLRERFVRIVEIPGYTDAELSEIFLALAEWRGFLVPEATQGEVLSSIPRLRRKSDFAQARTMDNLVMASAIETARRGGEKEILPHDVQAAFERGTFEERRSRVGFCL